MRYEDALIFCEWIKAELQSPLRYRLPQSGEIDAVLHREVRGSGVAPRAYWTTTQVAYGRDGRFWPLLRQSGPGQRNDPYPPEVGQIDQSNLNTLLTVDMESLSGCHEGEDSYGASIPAESRRFVPELSDSVTSTDLTELFRRTWPGGSACDVGQLEQDMLLAEKLVQQYLWTNARIDAATASQERLIALARRLNGLAQETLNRHGYADRRDDRLAQLRRSARLTALEAAAICISLHLVHGGSSILPPRNKLPRPTRNVPLPSRLPTVATNVLAHAFAAIYADFALLEARITGRIEPTEALTYVREAGNIPVRDISALLADADATQSTPCGACSSPCWIASRQLLSVPANATVSNHSTRDMAAGTWSGSVPTDTCRQAGPQLCQLQVSNHGG